MNLSKKLFVISIFLLQNSYVKTGATISKAATLTMNTAHEYAPELASLLNIVIPEHPSYQGDENNNSPTNTQLSLHIIPKEKIYMYDIEDVHRKLRKPKKSILRTKRHDNMYDIEDVPLKFRKPDEDDIKQLYKASQKDWATINMRRSPKRSLDIIQDHANSRHENSEYVPHQVHLMPFICSNDWLREYLQNFSLPNTDTKTISFSKVYQLYNLAFQIASYEGNSNIEGLYRIIGKEMAENIMQSTAEYFASAVSAHNSDDPSVIRHTIECHNNLSQLHASVQSQLQQH